MVEVKWIAKCLERLAEIGFTTPEDRNSRTYLSNKLVKLNSNNTNTQREMIIAHYHNAVNCDKRSPHYRPCMLYTLAKENKCVFTDFEYTEDKEGRVGAERVRVLTLATVTEGNYACSHCYFTQRMNTLLSRMEYAPLEVRLPMTTVDRNYTFFFVGLAKEDKDKKLQHGLLGFKYKVKTVKDNKQEEIEKAVLMSSALDGTIMYVELLDLEAEGAVMIDKEKVLTSLDETELEAVVYDINSVYFIDEDDNEINLGTRFQGSFDEAFKVGTLGIERLLKDVREEIKRIPNRRRKMTTSQVPKTDKAPADKPETKEEPLSILSMVLGGIIAVAVVGLFYVAYKSTLPPPDEDFKDM